MGIWAVARVAHWNILHTCANVAPIATNLVLSLKGGTCGTANWKWMKPYEDWFSHSDCKGDPFVSCLQVKVQTRTRRSCTNVFNRTPSLQPSGSQFLLCKGIHMIESEDIIGQRQMNAHMSVSILPQNDHLYSPVKNGWEFIFIDIGQLINHSPSAIGAVHRSSSDVLCEAWCHRNRIWCHGY